jgi:hypothetical protein
MQLTTIGLVLLLVHAFADDTTPRVVAIDPGLAALLQAGRTRSDTFRALIDQLEQSDWMVFIQPGRCPDSAAIGCLMHVVGIFEGRRYVRLLVNPLGRHPDQVIVTLAHELQHAWEVASAGEVTDGPSMLALFRRISSSAVKTGNAVLYETAAARRVEETVSRELRGR